MDRLLELFFKFLLILILGIPLLCAAIRLVATALGTILPWLVMAVLVAAIVAGVVSGVALAGRRPRRGGASSAPSASLGDFRVRRPRDRGLR